MSKLSFKKLVSCELAPNYTFRDVLTWLRYSKKADKTIGKYIDLGKKHYFVDSGRSGITLLLNSLDLKGEKVMIQAFSCVVVPNSVWCADMEPVVLDIEKNGYNIDLNLIEKNAKLGVKILIIQHTFGISVDMDKLMKIVDRYRLILIEDMAHALGNTWKGRNLGSFGYGAVYSFGRDKVLSSGTGGLVVVHLENKKIENEYLELPNMRFILVVQQLVYLYVVTLLVRPLYSLQIGKVILVILQKTGLINGVFNQNEKKGVKVMKITKYSGVLMKLLNCQFSNFEETQKNRLNLVNYYNKIFGLNYTQPLLRYPINKKITKKQNNLFHENSVLVGKWYDKVFIPSDEVLKKLNVKPEYIPNTINLLKNGVINLPTNINTKINNIKNTIDII
jgi:hypothetical protein